MEYPGTCATNVQVLNGFSQICCRVYTRRPDEASSTTRPALTSHGFQTMQAAEIAIRREGGLVTTESRGLSLWVFGTSKHHIIESVSKLRTDLGFAKILKCVQAGEFTAAQLLARAAITAKLLEKRSAPRLGWKFGPQLDAVDAVSIIAKTTDANSNASYGPELELPQPSLIGIYALFIQAFSQTLSFKLAKNSAIIPFNFRTFGIMTNDLEVHSNDDDLAAQVTNPLRLFDVDLQLTTEGLILLTSSINERPIIHQVSPAGVEPSTNAMIGSRRIVRIAPGGKISVLIEPEERSAMILSMRNGWIPKDQLPEQDPTKAYMQLWRQRVITWLCSKNIFLPRLEEDRSWAAIQFSRSVLGGNDAKGMGGHLYLEWPRALCFEKNTSGISNVPNSQTSRSVESSSEAGLQWYREPDNSCYQDPIDFALDFLAAQPSREAHIKSREVCTDNEERVMDGVGVGINDFQSPVLTRSMATYDTNTIYPTPPDAPQSGVTPGSLWNDGPIGRRMVAVVSQPEMSLESGPLHDDLNPEEQVVECVNDHEDLSNFDAGEPPAPDADDDLFESNGITEADFSFFDEPDVDPRRRDTSTTMSRKKLDLQGVLHEEQSSGNNTIVKHSENTTLRSDPGMDVFEVDADEMPDMQGTPRMRQSVPNEVAGAAVGVKAPLTPVSNPQSAQNDIPVDKHATASLQNRLGRQGFVDQDDHDGRWSSLTFNSGVWLSDLKYAGEGRYGIRNVQANGETGSLKNSRLNLEVPASLSDPRTFSRGTARGPRKGSVNQSNTGKTKISCDANSESALSDDEKSSGDDDPVPMTKRQKLSGSMLTPASGQRSDQPGTTTETEKNVPAAREVDIREKELVRSRFDAILVHLFSPQSSDWSLAHFPAPSERPRTSVSPLTYNSEGYLEIAQLLTSQCITSDNRHGLIDEYRQEDLDLQTRVSLATEEAIKHLNGNEGSDPAFLDLSSATAIQGRPKDGMLAGLKSQPKLVFQRSKGIEEFELGHAIFHIPTPYICVAKPETRLETQWEVLPTAASFWETLGLGPVNGPKDVEAYCIFPGSDATSVPGIRRFFDSIENSWDSFRLGCHRLCVKSDDSQGLDGLIPVVVAEHLTRLSVISAIKNACIDLGYRLSRIKSGRTINTVVYLVNPFDNSTALQDLCSCFWALIDSYGEPEGPAAQGLRKTTPILRIIPISMIASFDWPVSTDPRTFANLAREVYDCCQSSPNTYTSADLPILCEASINLAEANHQSVQFLLTSEPPSNLLHEDSCMHVAYCQSLDDMWITAAWTDNTGKYQHTACYSLAGSQTFGRVAREIWEATLAYSKSRKVTWRLFLVSVGPMSRLHTDIWHELVLNTPPSTLSLSVSLLSVDTKPMVIISPNRLNDIASISKQNNNQTTPISTLQNQMQASTPTTPAAGFLPSTPSGMDNIAIGDNDAAARLINRTDESWGIVLDRRLNVSRSIIDYNPALASGYLMKRTGPDDLDRPVVMEVNLTGAMHARGTSYLQGVEDSNPGLGQQTYDGLLKDILIMYRALGLLARLRGAENETSCTPWHIAVVLRAADALRICMSAMT